MLRLTYKKIELKCLIDFIILNIINIMNIMFETLFIKRFCLEHNADVSKYESGDLHVNTCLCGSFYHIACTFKGSPKCFEEG